MGHERRDLRRREPVIALLEPSVALLLAGLGLGRFGAFPAEGPPDPTSRVPGVLRLCHTVRLAADVGSYARLNRAWWIVPIVAVLAAALTLGAATQTVVPYAVYTLF